MKKISTLFVGFLTIIFTLNAQELINDNVGSGDVYWTKDNTYLLDGRVFVEEGTTLHIEAGTVVKGKPGEGDAASYLCVAQGGKIMAEGTAQEPIIFTFEADPLDGSTSVDTRGQWGGLIVLGKSGLNSTPGVSNIEGIPTSEPRGQYGGDDDADNSGVIRYVSIRHGGTEIGAGNEINGLTLGGVGSGTVIENVEVIANKDDGIEFFGGTVSVQNAMVYGCGDDSFDYDEGWRGQLNSNWVVVASADTGDRGGEHDGGTDPETASPYATPVITYATFVGRGTDAGKRALTFRDNAGGSYSNSVFFNYAKGVDVEDLTDGEDSYARFLAGDLTFVNNVVDCGSNAFVTSAGADLSDYFNSNGNSTSTDHGLTWDAGVASLAGRADWATWTLAMTSGSVLPGAPQSVSIDEVESKDFLVYPNPMTGNDVNIVFNQSMSGSYVILNSVGQKVQGGQFFGKAITINGINQQGVYIINLHFANHQSVTKLLVK